MVTAPELARRIGVDPKPFVVGCAIRQPA